MTDATGTSQWVYNTANLLTSHYQPRPNQTVSYTYDANGRRRTMAMGGFTWTYGYDYANQLETLDFNGGYAHYTYWDNGLVSDKLNGNWSEAVYNYDNRSRTTEIKHIRHSDGFIFKDLTYQYDPASNVSQYQDLSNGESPVATWIYTTTYGYDPANRLTGESRRGSTGIFYDNDLTYNYDLNGNRSSTVRTYNNTGGPVTTTSTYTNDANDKTTFGEGFSFTYNSNGDPTQIVEPYRGTMNQTYDYESRLLSMSYTNGTPTSLFVYNGDGQRVEKTDSQGVTRYIYDGTSIIGEALSNNAVVTFHAPGVGYYLASTGAVHYFMENALGSSTGVIDETLARTDWYLYDGYGVTDILRQGEYTPFKYVGKHGYFTDGDSGMILLGHRYYMPDLGKFLTQDPKGHDAGLNLYEYASDNPLVHIDPTGMDPLNADQRYQVQRAIGVLQRLGYRDIPAGLNKLLSQGRIDVVNSNNDGVLANTDWGFWVTDSNVRIHIHNGFWIDNKDKPNSYGDFQGLTTLTSVLVHEFVHAFWQPELWQYFHPWQREDDAYAFEVRFLRTWRERTVDKTRIEIINDRMQEIVNRDKD